METKTAWSGFAGRKWKEDVDVRDFIQKNYEPYDGDECFLANPTKATEKLWGELQKLQKKEREQGGVLDMETEVVSVHVSLSRWNWSSSAFRGRILSGSSTGEASASTG